MNCNEFCRNVNKLSKGDVMAFLEEHKNENLPSGVLGLVFEKLYVNSEGISDTIKLSDLVMLHPSFSICNGASWSRQYGSYLGRYQILNVKENRKIVAVKTMGPRQNDKPDTYKKIPEGLIRNMKQNVSDYESGKIDKDDFIVNALRQVKKM